MSASTFPSTGSAEDDNLKIQSINENQEILEDSTISKGVLTKAHPNVRILGLVRGIGRCNLSTKEQAIQRLAIDIFRINGKGLTYGILMARGIARHKEQAQNVLKRCRIKDVLFTCEFDKAKPRGYYPSCIKAEVIEKLKKRQDVLMYPTGVNLSNGGLSSSNNPLYDALQYQRAQSFFETLILLTSTPIGIHKLQFILKVGKDHFMELSKKERQGNRGKLHEEKIGRRHVTYTFSPRGTVEIAVATTDLPFKLETQEDESIIFSFLGQVRDRLLYIVSDVHERIVPPIMYWTLKGCDINQDVEVDAIKGQCLPDIQLKYVDRVFRLYVKNFQEKSYYRVEESLTPNCPLVEALDSIRNPNKLLEEKIDKLIDTVNKFITTKLKESQPV